MREFQLWQLRAIAADAGAAAVCGVVLKPVGRGLTHVLELLFSEAFGAQCGRLAVVAYVTLKLRCTFSPNPKTTPGDYLARWRICIAQDALRGRSLKQVLNETGYTSAATFTRVFKAYAGVAPKVWFGKQPIKLLSIFINNINKYQFNESRHFKNPLKSSY